MRSLRPFIVYLAMVGLPLLGLLAILRVGQAIEPPRSVAGEWRLAEPTTACPAAGPATALNVEQSGTRAELHLVADHATLRLSAEVSPDSIVAAAHPSRRLPICGPLDLRLALDGAARVERLRGVLRVGACPSCEHLPFEAQRVVPRRARRGR